MAPLTPSFAAVAASLAASDDLSLTPDLQRKLLVSMEVVGSISAERNKFVNRIIDKLESKRKVNAAVEGKEIASVLTATSIDDYFHELHQIVLANAAGWKAHDVITFLEVVSCIPTKNARKLLRDAAPFFVSVVNVSNSTQLSTIAACCGRARVRNDVLCEAISNRAILVANELSVQTLSVVLASLAIVDYRVNKAFLELAPLVRYLIPKANATQIANLIGSFSKLMIWNYKLFSGLTQRAFELHQDFTFPQMVTVLSGLNRVNIRHEEMFSEFIAKVKGRSKDLTVVECVHLLSAFSNSGSWDEGVFNELGKLLVEHQQKLDAQLLGEALMAFARVGLRSHTIFQDMSLRALAIAPSCPPISIANIATAYSTVGCRHEELFSVLAERVQSIKDDCPAVTIGAILAAFANIDIKNDRLFIEMIPRVRHVAQYGSPKDVANVVIAYTSVGLWHYKLFVKLADRAVQLRGECRGLHIAQILHAYAKVEMRYERLFTEFAVRIQTIAHLLSVSEIVSILKSYSIIGIFESAVFSSLGDRLIDIIAAGALVIETSEAEQILEAYVRANAPHSRLVSAVQNKFPELAGKSAAGSTAQAATRIQDKEQQTAPPIEGQ